MGVAQRMYAKALFESAQEQGRLAEVHEQLGDFVAMVGEVPELGAVLANPELDSKTKAAILDDILGGADQLVRNFLRLVAEKGRTGEIVEIARELGELVALKFHAGLSNGEIAQVLGVSESNAGTMLHRAIEKVRKACNATA